jgi:nucleoid DNA-binding protein
MDKPISLSVKDYLIRKMAVKMMVTESTIDAVIRHQFSSANDATQKHKSLEISGFGKFYFNEKKAQKTKERLEKSLNEINETLQNNISESHRSRLTLKAEKINQVLKAINNKTNA